MKKTKLLLDLNKLNICKLTNPQSILGGTDNDRRSEAGGLCPTDWTKP